MITTWWYPFHDTLLVKACNDHLERYYLVQVTRIEFYGAGPNES